MHSDMMRPGFLDSVTGVVKLLNENHECIVECNDFGNPCVPLVGRLVCTAWVSQNVILRRHAIYNFGYGRLN